MNLVELKAYVLAHREDDEAIRALFSRRSPDSETIVFHLPKTKEEEQQQFELFKQIVEKKEGKKESKNLVVKEGQEEKEFEEKLRLKIEQEVEEKLRLKIEQEKDQESQG